MSIRGRRRKGSTGESGVGEKEEGRGMEEGGEKTTFLEEEPVGPVPRSPAICSEARHTKGFCWRGSVSPVLCGYLLSNLHISAAQPPCNLQSHSNSHGVISTLEQFFPKAPHHGKSPGLRVRRFQFELSLDLEPGTCSLLFLDLSSPHL